MAGDKKTILDIVKKADKLDLYEDAIKSKRATPALEKYYDFLGPVMKAAPESALLAERNQLEYKDIPRLEKKVLSEKHPTAGGTYKGSVYYSNILPQGEGDIPWSKKAATIVKNASQTGAKKSDILAAENYFVDIGYMHPSEVDGKKGKQVMGMIRRWNLNAGTSKEAMFDAMETWKDRLFDGGAEGFEEDFREGGGDQGAY